MSKLDTLHSMKLNLASMVTPGKNSTYRIMDMLGIPIQDDSEYAIMKELDKEFPGVKID